MHAFDDWEGQMQDIFHKIRQLGLPRDEFLVVGSGTLAALKLRRANDIDLLVTDSVYAKLKAQGWDEHTYETTGDKGLSQGDFEVVVNWHGTKLEDVMSAAIWLEGIAFANLEDVIEWKTQLARQKDIYDLELIRQYRSAQHALA